MAITHQVLLHRRGPALWPDHKPLQEVRNLQATTPESIWETTYQLNTVQPGGAVFKKDWWYGRNRYKPTDPWINNRVWIRLLSFDTAHTAGRPGDSENIGPAWTNGIVAELLKDYRMVIRDVWRDRIEFPEVPVAIEELAEFYSRDGLLEKIIIEDADSGTSALQTLRRSSKLWIRNALHAFRPTTSKLARAIQASVWCKLGRVLLPDTPEDAPWLPAFEKEIFSFPNSSFADQADSFSQLILYAEAYLEQGWIAAGGAD